MARLEAALASLKSAPVAVSHAAPSAEIGAGLGRVPEGVRLPPAGSRPTRATPPPPPEDPGAEATGEDISFEAAEPVQRRPDSEHAAPPAEEPSAEHAAPVDELSWEAAAPAEIEPEINMASVLAKVPPQVLDQLEEWFRTKPSKVRRVDLTKLVK